MANEIASAYVALYTKMPGVKKDIESALGEADAEGAGAKLGDGLGKGISTKQAAVAGAVGGIFASVANIAAGAIGDLVGEAVAASDATDKFAQTLTFAGLDTSAIDSAMSKSRAYADATVYDLSTIQNTTAQLAANGISNYTELTEAAGNLNAVAGGNQDTFSSVAMMLTQTAGAGKLTTENWNQLADAIPGASGRLQTALSEAGAFTGNFREAMQEGEITADEFNAALLQLGTEPVAQEAATSVSTMEGAVGNLQAAIVGGLSDAFTTIKPVLTDIVNGLAGFVTFIQDNISWIGPLAAGIAIVAGAVAAWAIAQWALNAAMTANPLGIIIVGIGLLIGAIILLVQNWDTVVKFLTDVWAGFISWITGVIDGFVGWWNGVWSAVGQWISSVWNGIVFAIQYAWNSVQTWLVGVISGLVNWWNGVWKGIGDVIANVFGSIGRIIGGIWDGIISGIRSAINTIIRLINGVIDGVNVLVGGAGSLIGLDIAIPKIPMLATGGTITRAGSVIVGERGPELLNLPAGASVNPNIANAGGLRPGDRITIEVEGTPLTGVVKRQMAVSEYRSAVRLSGGAVSA
ncbi:tape measure protein [Microbacterium telephonicum]|uniref:Tape measure domain-containing protein n=1 Tax=Microbacterium telephonicum TaxID=1714841 RepID=A0A498BVH6_9MICO|nr:tape measure protein [Microbacterium telephonicum]RLK47615.1 tape measure domain-containing protein [Microbacterium telephonicum]